MNILELKQEQQQLLDTLFFDDTNEELIQSRLEAIQGDVNTKLEYLSTVLLEARYNETSRKDALNHAQKRHKVAMNAVDRLKGFILETMADFSIKKVKGDYCDITLQQGREVAFIPQDADIKALLPNAYYKTVPEQYIADKKAITTALKEGVSIPGVELVRGFSHIVVR